MSIQHDAQIAMMRKAQEALNTKNVELAEKYRRLEAEGEAVEIRTIIGAAVEAGVAPAMFGEYEPDPAAWREAKFSTFESFKEFVSNLRGVTKSMRKDVPNSGHDPRKVDDSADKTVQITADDKKAFTRLKIGDGTYAGATTEEEATLRMEEAKANKKAA